MGVNAHLILLSNFIYRLRVELIVLAIAFIGLALELILGIITLWIFQRYRATCGCYTKITGSEFMFQMNISTVALRSL